MFVPDGGVQLGTILCRSQHKVRGGTRACGVGTPIYRNARLIHRRGTRHFYQMAGQQQGTILCRSQHKVRGGTPACGVGTPIYRNARLNNRGGTRCLYQMAECNWEQAPTDLSTALSLTDRRNDARTPQTSVTRRTRERAKIVP